MKTYDNVYKIHGAFSWTELITSDPVAAVKFYSQLLGWKIEKSPSDVGPGDYHHIQAGDTSIGGIMGKPPGTPPDMPSMWGCYVTVTDLDQTLAAVKRLGGGVLMEPMEVKTIGRMAVIRDPQGAALSVIQYTG